MSSPRIAAYTPTDATARNDSPATPSNRRRRASTLSQRFQALATKTPTSTGRRKTFVGCTRQHATKASSNRNGFTRKALKIASRPKSGVCVCSQPIPPMRTQGGRTAIRTASVSATGRPKTRRPRAKATTTASTLEIKAGSRRTQNIGPKPAIKGASIRP